MQNAKYDYQDWLIIPFQGEAIEQLDPEWNSTHFPELQQNEGKYSTTEQIQSNVKCLSYSSVTKQCLYCQWNIITVNRYYKYIQLDIVQ